MGPPVCARLAAISLSDSGLKSPTLLLAGLAQPSSQTTPSREIDRETIRAGHGAHHMQGVKDASGPYEVERRAAITLAERLPSFEPAGLIRLAMAL
jgi:hypothetical protein